jgi:molybdate transport system ATP-binding protein
MLQVDIRKKLHDFTLDVSFKTENEIMGILGSSGCGKSMTLKCIAGIERPDSGRIVLNDRVLFDSDKKINIPPQKRKAGYLFQNYALFPKMTVFQNIVSGIQNATAQQKAEIAKKHIEFLGLTGLENRYPAFLSGGQQQRVAIARILVSDPEIFMLDEPFSALDQFLKEQTIPTIMDIINRFEKNVLLITHDMDEAFVFCDKIAVMSNGKIDTMGEKTAVFRNPKTIATAKITGVKNITPIRRIGAHTFFAVDWNIELRSEEPVPDDCTHACIRAHFLRITEQDGENCFPCTAEKKLESRFTLSVLFRSEKQGAELIRLNSDKALVERAVVPGEKYRIYFPPERINFLKQ